ncbi:hypothetical protein [Halonotius aquaticus]|uniref:hypothetical protein n=1 Tax=Halonotius aquaticus TaxID=2216978 RepID=UPI001058CEDB|nr:hypothetical protein [Halonotius aquaticus]
MAEWNEKETSSTVGPIISDTQPSSPSKGDEWVDTSYLSPAKKIYLGDSGWATLITGTNVPDTQTYTSNAEVDVSGINETVRIGIVGESGEGTGRWSPGGEAGRGTIEVDLSSYNTLKLRPGSLEGETSSQEDQYIDRYSYSTGAGGSGTAIRDGQGNVIAIAGGGGGEADYGTYTDDGYGWIRGASGGEGGPTGTTAGGNGGSYTTYWNRGQNINTHDEAEDGGVITRQDAATVVSQTTGGPQNSVTLFK